MVEECTIFPFYYTKRYQLNTLTQLLSYWPIPALVTSGYLSRAQQRYQMTTTYYRWHVARLFICLSLYTTIFAFAPTKIYNKNHHHHHHFTSSLKGGSGIDGFSSSGNGSDLAVVNNSLTDKNNRNNNKDINLPTKPRLVSLVETTIKWCTKYILLKQCATISVDINTTSNRALLQGKINAFSISMRDCMFRFNMLSFKKLDISGNNLHLGYMPFILPLLLPYLLWRIRSYIWTAFVSVFILQMTGYIEPTALSQIYQRVKERMYNIMGARSSTINYSMAISQENIAKSIVLKFWLKGILRSLVDNSVVGAAAVFGDVQKDVNAEIRRQVANNDRAVPLLPSSSDSSSTSIQPKSEQQQGITSALLSATNFELHKTMFQDNRIVLNATAVVPEKAGSSRRCPFTIRAKCIPTTVINSQLIENGDNYNALGFASPECRLNSAPLTTGTILEKLLPDVLWIPFGAGVAVQLGKSNCRIYRADILKDACRLDGAFTMFAPPPRDGRIQLSN